MKKARTQSFNRNTKNAVREEGNLKARVDDFGETLVNFLKMVSLTAGPAAIAIGLAFDQKD